MHVSTSIPIPVRGLRAHRESTTTCRYDIAVAKIAVLPRSRGARIAKRAVDVVLSSAVTTLSGAVQDSHAKPVTDYVVVAFAQDSSKWGYLTRFVRTARPNQEGRFSLTGLPPDDYYVVALDYVETGEEYDPEQLEKWKSLATRVTLADAESKPLALKLASPSQ